jgi:hypothetical protein
MRGDKVIVRAYGGEALSRLVWDTNERVVYVVTKDTFEALQAGRSGPEPVGFPWGDVFESNGQEGCIMSGNIDWGKFRRYRPITA